MGVTDIALAVMFANPVMARDATWVPGGTGPGQSVRVILRTPDTVTDFGAARVWSETVIADIRVAKEENCFPMIPSGAAHNDMLLGPEDQAEKPVSEEGMVLV